MRCRDRDQFADPGIGGRREDPGSLPFPRQVGAGNQAAHAVNDKIDLGNRRAVRVLKSGEVNVELSGQLFDRNIAVGTIVEIGDPYAVGL